MCNLYSITTNQAAIIALFRVMTRYVGNLPPMPGVFPDCRAPVVRNAGTEREIVVMRWGMPPPPRLADSQSPTSGTRHHPTGGLGSSQRTAAWTRAASTRDPVPILIAPVGVISPDWVPKDPRAPPSRLPSP